MLDLRVRLLGCRLSYTVRMKLSSGSMPNRDSMKGVLAGWRLCVIAVSLGWAAARAAPAAGLPAGLPAGTTATCNDGSFSSSADKRGACRGHRGIKEWYGQTPAPGGTQDRASGPQGADEHASGRGVRTVWVNEGTKVYHCPNSEYFGKTSAGFYLSEPDAVLKGYHANQNKRCF